MRARRLARAAATAGSFASACLLAATIWFCLPGEARAGSDAAFPADWQSWPVVKTGAIEGTDVTIPATAAKIVQETMKAYNWINGGKGSPYQIQVAPAQAAAYAAGKAGYADGSTAVLELTNAHVILVTEHLLGEPQYGVFTFQGKDLADAHPSLRMATCSNCHSGYADICVGGICSAPRK